MYKLKVSKSGDVRTENNPENLVFDSGKSTLGFREKVIKQTTTDGNGKVDTNYQHGLEYVPIVLVFVTTRGGKKIAVPNQWEAGWGKEEVLEENFYYYVDDDKVYLQAYAHHYEPWQGGEDTPLSNQNYNFEINFYFNELNDEF